MAKAAVSPDQAAAVAAGNKWKKHSDLIRLEASFVGIGADGTRYDMGTFVSGPRSFKPGSMGFNVSEKAQDKTETGVSVGTRFQIGANITAIGSKEW